MTHGRGRILALAAAGWAIAFAIPSFYWAAGGERGLATIAHRATTEERDLPLVTILAATGLLKVALGGLAIALVRVPAASALRRVLFILAVAAGLGMSFYAMALFIQHGLMLAGWTDTPEAFGERALRWHLLFWDPWWFAGGALFLLLADAARRGTIAARAVTS